MQDLVGRRLWISADQASVREAGVGATLERGKGNRHTARAGNGACSSEYAQALSGANATRQDANRWLLSATLSAKPHRQQSPPTATESE